MNRRPSIVWFHQDLRLNDNPALSAALKQSGAVIPIFIWAPEEDNPWSPGEASRWWLHHSLESLEQSLHECGARLIVRKGPTRSALHDLLRETNAEALFWNRRYEPALVQRDRSIMNELLAKGITVRNFNAKLLFEPWEILTKSRTAFQVFSPFWKTCKARLRLDAPIPAPPRLPSPKGWPGSLSLQELQLEGNRDRAEEWSRHWEPGEAAALMELKSFLQEGIESYAEHRDCLHLRGTSHLSPHIHFGEIGPRQIVHAIQKHGIRARRSSGVEAFLKEIGWREFAHHLLYHFPHASDQALRPEFARFLWQSDRDTGKLADWRHGYTGYPIVDAGMRELWRTGWMHNRLRMIVASFLVKDLLVPWQQGTRWFWDTLMDADLANNTLGWQWSSGTGVDATPYFRIFNPVVQGTKFDPEGDYVRRWIPELAPLPKRHIHKPWEAPVRVLQAAKIRLGQTYPKPIVDHNVARRQALIAYENAKAMRQG